MPLSQGWDVGDRLYVGGQISSDETGSAVNVGDLAAQTRAIYQYVENVLKKNGNASFAMCPCKNMREARQRVDG